MLHILSIKINDCNLFQLSIASICLFEHYLIFHPILDMLNENKSPLV